MSGALTSLVGPVELMDGKLVLLIPLEAGGLALSRAASGISQIEDDFLKVTIPDWLAAKLVISAGTKVQVDNRDGTFNIEILERP